MARPAASEDALPYAAMPSAKAKQIVAGRLHACALIDDGTVRCWGYSPHVGTMGSGEPLDDTAFPVPVGVKGLSNVKQIAANSSDYTCALTTAGAVKCWGDDEMGTLSAGVPYTDSRPHASSTPLDIPGLGAGVAAISVGTEHACALMDDHSMKCWGHNGSWIGDGNDHLPGDSDSPNQVGPKVVDVHDIVQMSVGHEHTCAVTSAGTVKCWGTNTFGEVGDGTDNWRVKLPTDIAGLTDVAKVVAGDRTSCAVMNDGSMKCWGTREWGSIGDGKKDDFDGARSPVAVANVGGVATDVTTNQGFACGLIGGGVKCWGETPYTRDAQNTTSTYQPAGFIPTLESGVTQIVNGSGYACALLTNGAVKCWGDGHGGALGNGKANDDASSDTPVPVLSLP